MSGVKGRSGRRTKYEENVLQNSIEIGLKLLNKTMNDESIPEKERLEIITPYLQKKLPDLHLVQGQIEHVSIESQEKLLTLLERRNDRLLTNDNK